MVEYILARISNMYFVSIDCHFLLHYLQITRGKNSFFVYFKAKFKRKDASCVKRLQYNLYRPEYTDVTYIETKTHNVILNFIKTIITIHIMAFKNQQKIIIKKPKFPGR